MGVIKEVKKQAEEIIRGPTKEPPKNHKDVVVIDAGVRHKKVKGGKIIIESEW